MITMPQLIQTPFGMRMQMVMGLEMLQSLKQRVYNPMVMLPTIRIVMITMR